MRHTAILLGVALLGSSLALGACGPSLEEEREAWIVDHSEQEGALLSVWGTSPDDVWAAGGRVGAGLLLHNTGGVWNPVEAPATELLWSVYGFTADDVYAVGERGLILHFDGTDWERLDSGTTATLYGVWGANGDEVWVVGGDASGSEGSAVVLRGGKNGFDTVDSVPAALLPSTFFKVYGGPSHIVAVGSGGAVLRLENGTWRRDQTPTNQPLFSLWGRDDNDVYAVGGYASSEVLHFNGDQWHKVHETPVGPGLAGVFTAADQPAIAVGADNYIVEIDAAGSTLEPELPAFDLVPQWHGVWGDGAGNTYVVGGDLLAYPDFQDGLILLRRE